MKHLIKRTQSRQNLEYALKTNGLPGPTVATDMNGRGILASGAGKDFRLSPLGRKIEKGQLDFTEFDRDFTRKSGISSVSASDVFYNFDIYNSLLVASNVYDLNTSSSMGDIHIAYNNFVTPRYGYAELTVTKVDSNWTRIKFDFLNTVKNELGLSGLRIPAKNPKFAVGKKFGRFSVLDIDEWIPNENNTGNTTQFFAVVPSNTVATQDEIELAVKILGLENYYYESSLSPDKTYTSPSQLPIITLKDTFTVSDYKSSGQVDSLDKDWNAHFTTNIESNSMFASMCKFLFDYYDANSYGNFGYSKDSFSNPQNSWVNCYNNNKNWIYTTDIVSSLKHIKSFSELSGLFGGKSFCVEFIWSRYCDPSKKIVTSNIFDCRMDTVDLATFDNFIGGDTANEIKQSILGFQQSYSKYRNGVYARAVELAHSKLEDYQANGTFKIDFETLDGYYFDVKYFDTSLFKIGFNIIDDENYHVKKLIFNIDKDSLATNGSEIFISSSNGPCWNITMENSEKPSSGVYDKAGTFSIYCKRASIKYLIDIVVYIDDSDGNALSAFLKYTVKNMSTSKTHVL